MKAEWTNKDVLTQSETTGDMKDWKVEIVDMLNPKPIILEDKPNQKKCGMCGLKAKKLYHYKIGSVNKYICGRCKAIMDM